MKLSQRITPTLSLNFTHNMPVSSIFNSNLHPRRAPGYSHLTKWLWSYWGAWAHSEWSRDGSIW